MKSTLRELCPKVGDGPKQPAHHGGVDRASTARLGRATKEEKKRVKDLERELARKDRALAETAALLVLRKKVQAIWGDEKQSGASQIKPFPGRFDAPNEDA